MQWLIRLRYALLCVCYVEGWCALICLVMLPSAFLATATGCRSNFSEQIYHISFISHHISCHIVSNHTSFIYHIISYHISCHLFFRFMVPCILDNRFYSKCHILSNHTSFISYNISYIMPYLIKSYIIHIIYHVISYRIIHNSYHISCHILSNHTSFI
jgi:hypothetical protein